MACAAVLSRLHYDQKISHHWLGNHPLIHRQARFLATDLRTEREYLVLIVDHGRTINCGHAASRIYSPAHRAFPISAIFLLDFLTQERRKRREGWSDRVENRLR